MSSEAASPMPARKKLVSICVHSWLQRRRIMNETHREDPHAPLSYHGAWRIVWLLFVLFIGCLIRRAMRPVILLFSWVFLLAMVLNPSGVWLLYQHVPVF